MSQASTSSRIVSIRTAYFLLALVIVVWGANWPVMKVGLQWMPPLTFAATRLVLGALTMFGVNAAMGQVALPERSDLPVVFGVGLMQMGGFLALVVIGLQYVPAGRSAILAYTTSLWVVPMASLFLGERLLGLRLIGFLLGIGGVVVLFNPLGFDWSDPQVIFGNALLLTAALLWAILIVTVRGRSMRGSPLSLAPWQFSIGALLLVPLALIMEWGQPIDWTAGLAAVLVYNGPVATAFGFWATITFTRALPAITTSLATLGVPVFGMALAAATLGEALTWTNLLGLALILTGLTCVTLADRRRVRNAV